MREVCLLYIHVNNTVNIRIVVRRLFVCLTHSLFKTQFSTAWDLVLPLSIYGSCLHLLRPLSVTALHPSIFPSTAFFIRQFLCKVWPILLAFLHFICVGYSLLPLLYVTIHFSHIRSNRFSPSFSGTTFEIFPDVSDLLSEVFRFQLHTTVCFKYNIFIVFP